MMGFSTMTNGDLAMLVIIVGAVVLAVVIIGVAFMMSLFGRTAFLFEKMGSGALKTGGAKKSAAPAAKKASAPVSGGVPGEVVAAISAAVAEVMGTGNFKIHSIRKKTESRSAWGLAGVLDSTRPF